MIRPSPICLFVKSPFYTGVLTMHSSLLILTLYLDSTDFIRNDFIWCYIPRDTHLMGV